MHQERWSAIAALSAGLLTATAGAQPYSIDSFTIDGGGGTLTGSTFEVSGTIGQPDAGVLAGSTFSLRGGFWMAAADTGCNPADIAQPFGLLDLNDINTFIGAFISQDLLGDVNGDGLLDLADINVFISSFLAGCP